MGSAIEALTDFLIPSLHVIYQSTLLFASLNPFLSKMTQTRDVSEMFVFHGTK